MPQRKTHRGVKDGMGVGEPMTPIRQCAVNEVLSQNVAPARGVWDVDGVGGVGDRVFQAMSCD